MRELWSKRGDADAAAKTNVGLQHNSDIVGWSYLFQQQQSKFVFKNTDRRAGVAATGWAAVISDPVLLHQSPCCLRVPDQQLGSGRTVSSTISSVLSWYSMGMSLIHSILQMLLLLLLLLKLGMILNLSSPTGLFDFGIVVTEETRPGRSNLSVQVYTHQPQCEPRSGRKHGGRKRRIGSAGGGKGRRRRRVVVTGGEGGGGGVEYHGCRASLVGSEVEGSILLLHGTGGCSLDLSGPPLYPHGSPSATRTGTYK